MALTAISTLSTDMPIYQKVAGAWESADIAYVKVNGIHVAADAAYVKVAGTWEEAYTYDVTPPDAPVISAAIVDTYSRGVRVGNYIRVGMRMPGSVNNDEIKLIRVLTTYNSAFPTTQYGGTYTSASDTETPSEPWSEWRYNSYGTHTDTSLISYKQWPRNSAGAGYLVTGQVYHFSSWAQDFAGNWSVVSQISVTGPVRSTSSANTITKKARFLPNSSGSWTDGNDFTEGSLTQQSNPQSDGVFFYGNQIPEAIGQTGTVNDIHSAQILACREDDNGVPVANVYLFWHTYDDAGDVPDPPIFHHVTKVGTIAKGEVKWFNLPEAAHEYLGSSLKGFGFRFKDPAKATAFAEDYTVMKSIQSSQRSGELAVTWKENL